MGTQGHSKRHRALTAQQAVLQQMGYRAALTPQNHSLPAACACPAARCVDSNALR